MMWNIILCALFGRSTYQDLNGTCHIPLYCIEQSYSCIYISKNIPVHQFEWLESVSHLGNPESETMIKPLRLYEEIYHQLYDGIHWTNFGNDKNPHKHIMWLLSFPEPILLEKVVLQSHDWKMVLQIERICSIDFMESTFYVIILDPQIRDWDHLREELDRYMNLESSQSFGVIIPDKLQIDLKTVPYFHPTPCIRAITLLPLMPIASPFLLSNVKLFDI